MRVLTGERITLKDILNGNLLMKEKNAYIYRRIKSLVQNAVIHFPRLSDNLWISFPNEISHLPITRFQHMLDWFCYVRLRYVCMDVVIDSDSFLIRIRNDVFLFPEAFLLLLLLWIVQIDQVLLSLIQKGLHFIFFSCSIPRVDFRIDLWISALIRCFVAFDCSALICCVYTLSSFTVACCSAYWNVFSLLHRRLRSIRQYWLYIWCVFLPIK